MIKCSRKDCLNEGNRQPMFSFTAVGYPNAARARAILHGLVVCKDHATTNPEDFITDSGWDEFCNHMAASGLAMPDRKSVRIEYMKES